MGVSFAGISTGIPTDQLIESILKQEAAPLDRLQARQTSNNQKKNILQSIKTALTGLATSISSLNSSSLSARTATSSDTASVSASAKGGVAGSYDIVVNQLATKARLETDSFMSSPSSDPVGDVGDTYTIVGKDSTKTATITLQAGKTSLAELNEAINAEASNTGVSSTIVQTKPGEYKLVLSSTETGEGAGGGKEIGIYHSGANNALGVATNAADASSVGVNSTAAQNAKFTMNGVAMERASNTITDAVDGMTLTLNKADSNKTINVNVALDTDSIAKAYQDVVNKFNSAYQAYKNASGKGGPMAGDLSLMSMFSQLRSSLTGVIDDGNGGVLASSATIGLKTERDGTLSLDTKQLAAALKEDPDLVGRVLDKASSTTKTFVDSLTTTVGGTITSFINSIDSVNSGLSKQIDTIQARLDRRKELLTAQFGRLESLVGKLQSAGQSLSGLY